MTRIQFALRRTFAPALSMALFAACGERQVTAPDRGAPDASSTARFEVITVPPPVGTFRQVGGGWLYACALGTDGHLACWGRDESGRATPPAGSFLQVSAGKEHGCALRTDHTVACWGLNYNGEAMPLPGAFTQVSAGSYHSCALRMDGTIGCWGQDNFGQSTPPSGVFTEVSAGGVFSCALRPVGTVLCWGARVADHAAPAGRTFTHVSAGEEQACALASDGTISCWPGNGDGEGWSPAGTYTQVSVGLDHSCALRADGMALCWGQNDVGQSNPPPRPFTQVDAGDFNSCAIAPDQSVACWGELVIAPSNRPPVANPGGPYAGREGEGLMLLLQAVDPDADALTYSWDLGDGTTGSGRPQMPMGHVYADDGVYTIRLTVSDGRGGTDTKATTATIANVAPSIPAEGGLTGPAAPIQLIAGSASAPIRLVFGDPAGTRDTYAARIECGNGTVLSAAGIASPYAATCVYTAAGVYTVSATVSDEDGGTSAVARLDRVIVYDPGGAFATGGGWLTSPPSACPSICGGATGRAIFAFDARYPHGGSTAPEGSATFRLHASQRNPWRQDSRLEFRSTSIVVLIVAGQRVQLWGAGTMNGVPGYTFRITAVDGGSGSAADALRIEIWDPGKARVYDTQWAAAADAAVTTPVGGGQVSIHRQWRLATR